MTNLKGKWIETDQNEFLLMVTDRVDVGVFLNHKNQWKWYITANGLIKGQGASKEDAQTKALSTLVKVFEDWLHAAQSALEDLP